MKKRNFLEIGENVLLFGSGVGSVASIVSQQAFYAAAPLSLLLLVNLLNRRRFEHTIQRSTTATISQIDHQLSKDIGTLRQHLNSFPSRIEVTTLQKKALQKQQASLDELRREFNKQIHAFESQGINHLRQELAQLKAQQARLTEGFEGFSGYSYQFSLTSKKVESLEQVLAQFKTELGQFQNNLQAFANEPKVNLNAVNDQISHINRRLNNLPPPFDATALKQDVEAIIRLVGDLVPKRDMARLSYELENLQQQIQTIEQGVAPLRLGATVFKKQLDTLLTRLEAEKERPADEELNEQLTAETQQQFAQLSGAIAELQERLDRLQIPAQPVLELPELAWEEGTELNATEQVDGMLKLFDQDNTKEMSDFFSTIAQADPALTEQLTQLMSRVEQIEQNMVATQLIRSEAYGQNGQPGGTPHTSAYDLMFSLQGTQTVSGKASQGQSILEEVLTKAQRQLTIVLPSLDRLNFHDTCFDKLIAFLERGGSIELGLGYLEDAEQSRFDYCIDPHWITNPLKRGEFYKVLGKLNELKCNYPEHFTFKVLGTEENFVVCDRAVAVVGVQSLTTASNLFPNLEIGLRTDHPNVIESLINRFQQPILDVKDANAYYRRAATCYEMSDKEGAIANYTQALRFNPQDATAYNNRGVVRHELGNRLEALADFQQAIHCDPYKLFAYFNQAYVKADLGDQIGAIADFTQAVEMNPEFVAAYFHRGLTKTRQGDKIGAIHDYTQVLDLNPRAAIAYFYRGLAHTKMNNPQQAIEDLTQAADLFAQQGNQNYRYKAETMLQKLKQIRIEPEVTLEQVGHWFTSEPAIR